MGLVIKITNGRAKWSGGVIPYVFDDTWEKEDMDAVLTAMKEWENRTGGIIKFQWKKMVVVRSAPGYPYVTRATVYARPASIQASQGRSSAASVFSRRALKR